MSNILIIKHGSLGDVIQANGAIEDIYNNFKGSKILLLTTKSYAQFMSECPYLSGVIIDKRLPRWNIFNLLKLRRILNRYNFSHVFDLQNSSRTRFYQTFLLPNCIWSTTKTSLEIGESKKDFDKEPVLERMMIQLKKSGIKIKNTNNINLAWAFTNIQRIIKQHTNGEYILIFPFCSKKHKNKKWPYYKDLVSQIKIKYKNKYVVLVAPGPSEINEAQDLKTNIVLDNGESINLNQLISLINGSKYVISNDTGPAHICCHLNKDGLALFGSHTSAYKVSIESSNFKTKTVNDLNELDVSSVMELIDKNLN